MQDNGSKQTETKGAEKQGGIDLNKLSKENLKTLAQALIDENTEMERQFNELKEQSGQLEKSAQKAKQLSDMYTALNNDFNNYRKRNAEIETISKDNAVIDIALKIIPVYDNLKIALQSISNISDREGVEIIYRQFTDALDSLNIERIDCKGQPFDPNLHTALMAEETDDKSLRGSVKEVFADGYRYKDKIIKQSQVIVYKQ
ncbi:MAG: nucleotide exchange factor GrpE [Clostridia bacterium]|nr:nucleotide exchange factor GrpE [Clostridia bacterium]